MSLMMYKYNLNLLPKAIKDLYTKNNEIHNHNTRHSNLLHVPAGAHTRNFRYKSVLIWNELAYRCFKFDVSFVVFKKSLKNYLLHNTFELRHNA